MKKLLIITILVALCASCASEVSEPPQVTTPEAAPIVTTIAPPVAVTNPPVITNSIVTEQTIAEITYPQPTKYVLQVNSKPYAVGGNLGDYIAAIYTKTDEELPYEIVFYEFSLSRKLFVRSLENGDTLGNIRFINETVQGFSWLEYTNSCVHGEEGGGNLYYYDTISEECTLIATGVANFRVLRDGQYIRYILGDTVEAFTVQDCEKDGVLLFDTLA